MAAFSRSRADHQGVSDLPEVRIGRIHGYHLYHDHPRIGNGQFSTEDADDPGKTQRDFLHHLTPTQYPTYHLDLVGIPQPTGLDGTPSGHGDGGPDFQGLPCRQFRLWGWHQQLHRETVNLQNNPFAQDMLAGHQE